MLFTFCVQRWEVKENEENNDHLHKDELKEQT